VKGNPLKASAGESSRRIQTVEKALKGFSAEAIPGKGLRRCLTHFAYGKMHDCARKAISVAFCRGTCANRSVFCPGRAVTKNLF